MLVLSRRETEQLVIDTGYEKIIVSIVKVDAHRVRLGVEAPRHVLVDRSEVYQRREAEEMATA